MKPVKIDFMMIIDGNKEESFKTFGMFEENKLFFTDVSHQEYQLSFTKESLSLLRTGTINLDLLFLDNKTTSGSIKVDEHQMNLTIFTHRLVVSSNQIKLTYNLLEGTRKISSHQLKVEWIEKRKE